MFVVKKRIELKQFGEGWEEAYAIFSPFTFNDNDKLLKLRSMVLKPETLSPEDAKKTSDDMKAIMKEKFVEGKGFDGEKLVPITKENLGELPMEITVHILQVLQGQTLIPPKG